MLMASTRRAFPQEIWRRFACFRGVSLGNFAGQADICAGFDSRQLHNKTADYNYERADRRGYVKILGVAPGPACDQSTQGRHVETRVALAREQRHADDVATLVERQVLCRAPSTAHGAV